MSKTNTIESTLHFEDISYLGAGTYATVRKIKYKSQIAAVKIFKKGVKDFLKEINELKKIDHPNVIKLIAHGTWKDKVDLFNCMIIEYADVGSLHHVLYETDLLYTLEHAIRWLLQCSDAINYLHTMKPKPTIHRDLKPLNLLLMKGGTILKVCDFGTACPVRTFMTVDRGSPCWIAPEQLMNDHYDEKCDVYSYAIISWEIICRLSPYFDKPNLSSAQIMLGVTKTTNPLRPKPVASCPKIIELLLDRGMDGDPVKRPSMQLIYDLMKKLDSLINATPVKPIVVENEPENQSQPIESTNNNNNLIITNTNDTGISSNIRSPDNTVRETIENPAELPDIYRKNDKLNNNNLSEDTYKPGHRRSRSYGTNPISIENSFVDKIKMEVKTRIETMLYDPLEPMYNNNESIQIFNNHRSLIKYDEKLQKNLNNLKAQKDQLESTIKNINLYNELQKQKSLLQSENDRLRKMLL